MSRLNSIPSTIILILLSAGFLYAYWPTSVRESLEVSVQPDTGAGIDTRAIPYPDGSIFTIFHKQYYGYQYQIIDKYGELKYEQPQYLVPGNPSFDMSYAELVSDGMGGAIAAWRSWNNNPIQGVVAQRIDSLGTLLWGDSGVLALPYPETDFNICSDGEGGMLLVCFNEGALDLYAQKIDSEGNILWGAGGVPVSVLTEVNNHVIVASDGAGGMFAVYKYDNTETKAQHLDVNGNRLWEEDLYLCPYNYESKIIPDEEGGFIYQAGSMYQNDYYRVSGEGDIIWQQNNLSWLYQADIVLGEPGYFYLGFIHYGATYGQRVRISDGMTFWPTMGSTEGAIMANYPNNVHNMHEDFAYSYPYFYGVFDYRRDSYEYPYFYVTQKLDSRGTRMWGENGKIMVVIDNFNFDDTNTVPDGRGGVAAVYCLWHAPFSANDTYAKHCDAEANLGGPLHLLVDIEPQNPPIQIPPGGGSFTYNLSVSDTMPVGTHFDAWIEATLPNGQDLEIMHRDNITIQPNSVIQRPNMTQVVPANAPAGTYIYHLYVGNREYDDIWSEDSFEFVKLE